eukprot:CAMPEP_0115855908 /NCGR_PEP_ID=MMETSP0287-20121206/14782_1 /TAXON_ID=412157 /ORGANISM="Chrysochromulina rotalis, Strain UIO044" /LENGTH=182 /DNA_ID=CAMNT_0003310071 /DNA_START=264 /DNA_END=812 /DNA_ORIENTATION=-
MTRVRRVPAEDAPCSKGKARTHEISAAESAAFGLRILAKSTPWSIGAGIFAARMAATSSASACSFCLFSSASTSAFISAFLARCRSFFFRFLSSFDFASASLTSCSSRESRARSSVVRITSSAVVLSQIVKRDPAPPHSSSVRRDRFPLPPALGLYSSAQKAISSSGLYKCTHSTFFGKRPE